MTTNISRETFSRTLKGERRVGEKREGRLGGGVRMERGGGESFDTVCICTQNY